MELACFVANGSLVAMCCVCMLGVKKLALENRFFFCVCELYVELLSCGCAAMYVYSLCQV